ncbi:MAG: carboxypeptidase-like regulatory domain-containing protein [Bacteroidales bacterium]|nr:carboxypeptidase-like regulatory domain-containing protein [Bacteroidales bacterium]
MILVTENAFSQHSVSGRISDALTHEPVGFANVIVNHSGKGTISDFDGFFEMSKVFPGDTLFISFLGYEPREIPVDTAKMITIPIFPSVYALDEVVVKPGLNPAHLILKNIWRNNDQNNMNKLKAYEYEKYSRTMVYFRKFNYRDSASLIRPLKNEFNNHSVSTGEEGIPALPAYVSENISDVYYTKSPVREAVHIKLVRSDGLAFKGTDLVSQLTTKQENFNFLNNNVQIIDKAFVSPASRFGLLYYKYYLIDSMYLDNTWCYEIRFVPKRKEEAVFKGTMWITDTTYAIKRISAEIGKKSDVNFIQRIKIQQDYSNIGACWFPVKERFMADAANIYITNYSEKKNIETDKVLPDSFYKRELSIEPDAGEKDNPLWDSVVVGSLTQTDSMALPKLNH